MRRCRHSACGRRPFSSANQRSGHGRPHLTSAQPCAYTQSRQTVWQCLSLASADPILHQTHSKRGFRRRRRSVAAQAEGSGPLPQKCDVAVVGAGISGLIAARKLHQAGAELCWTLTGELHVRTFDCLPVLALRAPMRRLTHEVQRHVPATYRSTRHLSMSLQVCQCWFSRPATVLAAECAPTRLTASC